MRRTLALNKLDLSSVAADSVVLIIGRRATGKSVLAMDVLRAAGFADKEAMKGNETRGLIFSPTEKTTPFYGPAFADAPGVHIVDEYSPTSLALSLSEQKVGGSAPARSFVVFDNCMFDTTWANGREINQLFAKARRTRTTIVLTIPYPLGLPPCMLSHVDYVFMLRENNLSCRLRLRELYAPVFEKLDTFIQVMDEVTQDKGACVVIDNAPKTCLLEDCVFWYAAADSAAATD